MCVIIYLINYQHLRIIALHASGSVVDFRVQEVVPSLVCCPSLGCQVSLPLPPPRP